MPPLPFRLFNVAEGEDFPHSLVILEGFAAECRTVTVSLSGRVFSTNETANGFFKAVVQLEEGDNSVVLEGQRVDNGAPLKLALNLTYSPTRGDHEIRLVYLLTEDSDGDFQCPDDQDNSLIGALFRIKTMALMIQCATAELLKRQYPNHPRRTFQISDEVYEHRVSLTTADARCMSGMDLWQFVYGTLPTDSDTCINLVVISASWWDGSQALAHTALGGGGLALFGSASMFSWPVDPSEISARLLDETLVNPEISFDDGHRGVRWGLCSTTVGACLHELGHCLSLPHPGGDVRKKRDGGIMERGFDHLNRLFSVTEAGRAVSPDEEPIFDRGSAARLLYHSFLTQRKKKTAPNISIISPSERIVAEAEHGIRHVGFYFGGDNYAHEEYTEGECPPTRVELYTEEKLRNKCNAPHANADKFEISICDDLGHIVTKTLKQLKDET